MPRIIKVGDKRLFGNDPALNEEYAGVSAGYNNITYNTPGFSYSIMPLAFNLEQKGNDPAPKNRNKAYKYHVGEMVKGYSPYDKQTHKGVLQYLYYSVEDAEKPRLCYIVDMETNFVIPLDPDTVRMVLVPYPSSPKDSDYFRGHSSEIGYDLQQYSPVPMRESVETDKNQRKERNMGMNFQKRDRRAMLREAMTQTNDPNNMTLTDKIKEAVKANKSFDVYKMTYYVGFDTINQQWSTCIVKPKQFMYAESYDLDDLITALNELETEGYVLCKLSYKTEGDEIITYYMIPKVEYNDVREKEINMAKKYHNGKNVRFETTDGLYTFTVTDEFINRLQSAVRLYMDVCFEAHEKCEKQRERNTKRRDRYHEKKKTNEDMNFQKRDRRAMLRESALTPREKIEKWMDGTREVNVKACSPDKLRDYYKLCDEIGFDKGMREIETVAREKNVKLGKEMDECNEALQRQKDAIFNTIMEEVAVRVKSILLTEDFDSFEDKMQLSEEQRNTIYDLLMDDISLDDNNIEEMISSVTGTKTLCGDEDYDDGIDDPIDSYRMKRSYDLVGYSTYIVIYYGDGTRIIADVAFREA